eukprot:2448142-Rhodomonas_salina.1
MIPSNLQFQFIPQVRRRLPVRIRTNREDLYQSLPQILAVLRPAACPKFSPFGGRPGSNPYRNCSEPLLLYGMGEGATRRPGELPIVSPSPPVTVRRFAQQQAPVESTPDEQTPIPTLDSTNTRSNFGRRLVTGRNRYRVAPFKYPGYVPRAMQNRFISGFEVGTFRTKSEGINWYYK